MNVLPPHQLADLWYLQFGNNWIMRSELSSDWKDIAEKLKQNNLADYDLVYTPNNLGMQEIIKLKETCK